MDGLLEAMKTFVAGLGSDPARLWLTLGAGVSVNYMRHWYIAKISKAKALYAEIRGNLAGGTISKFVTNLERVHLHNQAQAERMRANVVARRQRAEAAVAVANEAHTRRKTRSDTLTKMTPEVIQEIQRWQQGQRAKQTTPSSSWILPGSPGFFTGPPPQQGRPRSAGRAR
ncbi:hypothetical protein [Marinactinospora rubrisoli]|uniref:Uncharacterized protein n=1 Tax=Marinactinospora rubrisoli TaxID=2715399 RepID=A0ABW2KP86_9ACTN